MRILDRYLIKKFTFPLFYCLFVFCLLYVIVDVFGHLDEILKNKVPVSILLQYYASFIPLIFVQTAPVATLLAMVYMLNTLNKSNELIAAKSCGISIARLLLPVFAMGVVLSLMIFMTNENMVPGSIVTAEKIKTNYIEKSYQAQDSLKIIKDLTVYGKSGQIIYAGELNPMSNTLKDIIILEHGRNHGLTRKILAPKALWTGREWLFYDCTVFNFDKLGESRGRPEFLKEKVFNITESPRELLRHEFQTMHMSYGELKEHIRRLSGTGDKTISSLTTELYFKGALPFVCFIIMLLGMPFALTTRRGGAMQDIGLSVLVGLLYYSSIYFSLALGKGGILPPMTAAHLPNVTFLIIALFLLYRSPR